MVITGSKSWTAGVEELKRRDFETTRGVDNFFLAASYHRGAIFLSVFFAGPKVESVFNEMDCLTPVIYLLSAGADPTDSIEGLARKKKTDVACVSMGEVRIGDGGGYLRP